MGKAASRGGKDRAAPFKGGHRKAAKKNRLGRSPDRASRLQLSHALRQCPQRPVEADVLVDALDGAGTLAASAGRTAGKTALDETLLHLCGRCSYVEYRQQTAVKTRFLLFFST